MTSLVTGFVLGVAGSVHCVGMCGPLVLTIGRSVSRASRRVQYSALYHGGRVLTYMVLAIPVGVLGQALALRGLGRALAIVTAVLLLASAVGAASTRWTSPVGRLAAAAASRACNLASRWRQVHPIAGPVVAGAANGLVPCGLVYSAVMVAASMGTVRQALLVMLGFGLGTIPMLFALSMSADWVPVGVRVKLRRLTPVVLALAAALLLVRSLAPWSAPHFH
jgi:uncharacterized protein